MTNTSTIHISWVSEDTLSIDLGQLQTTYPQNVANQLILCARMNPWDRFMAMMEKKTNPDQWAELQRYLGSLDKQTSWKVKEQFARLSTHEA